MVEGEPLVNLQCCKKQDNELVRERDRQSCCPLTGMEAGLLTTTMSSSM